MKKPKKIMEIVPVRIGYGCQDLEAKRKAQKEREEYDKNKLYSMSMI